MGCCNPQKNQTSLQFNQSDPYTAVPKSKRTKSQAKTTEDSEVSASSSINREQFALTNSKIPSNIEANAEESNDKQEANRNINTKNGRGTNDDRVEEIHQQKKSVEQEQIDSANIQVQERSRKHLFQSYNNGLPLRTRFGPLWIINEEESQCGNSIASRLDRSSRY